MEIILDSDQGLLKVHERTTILQDNNQVSKTLVCESVNIVIEIPVPEPGSVYLNSV